MPYPRVHLTEIKHPTLLALKVRSKTLTRSLACLSRYVTHIIGIYVITTTIIIIIIIIIINSII
jgi:hypothetical protein